MFKGFPSMLGAIVAQDWDEAAAQVDSDWCGQVGKGYHSNGDLNAADTELRYKAAAPAADSFSNRRGRRRDRIRRAGRVGRRRCQRPCGRCG